MVTVTPALLPQIAVIGHARGSAVQHVGDALLAPRAPLLRRPLVSFARLGHEGLARFAVAGAAQIPAAQRSHRRTSHRRQSMINLQKARAHAWVDSCTNRAKDSCDDFGLARRVELPVAGVLQIPPS